MLGWRSLEALSARLAQYGFERSRPRSRELQLDQSRKGAASSAPVKSESLDGDTDEHGSFWRVVPERTREANERWRGGAPRRSLGALSARLAQRSLGASSARLARAARGGIGDRLLEAAVYLDAAWPKRNYTRKTCHSERSSAAWSSVEGGRSTRSYSLLPPQCLSRNAL